MSLAVLLAVLVTQTCGALAPIFTKLALAGLPPWSMVTARQLVGIPLLFALARLGQRGGAAVARVPFDRRDWALVLTLSWAGFALPQLLLAIGIARSTGTNGALLSPLEPIGILIGGALFFRERLTSWRLVAVALGTLGALCIVVQGGVRPELGDPVGDALIAAGHLAWAIYTLAAKPLLERHDPGRVSLAAVAFSIPPLALLASTETIEPARALVGLGWVVALAFTATALGTYTWNYALRSISAGTMATFIFIQPIVGLAAGRVALNEPVGPLALAGAFLILVGVTLEARRTAAEPASVSREALQSSTHLPS
jgi:drug/metabolite transporter (DMT)-like permease